VFLSGHRLDGAFGGSPRAGCQSEPTRSGIEQPVLVSATISTADPDSYQLFERRLAV
jgi:hypothetical protein